MPNNSAVENASPVAVVGAGTVGSVLARRLVACGYRVHAILSRDPVSARALADRVGAAVGSDEWTALPGEVRLVMICVTDDAIAAVADELASVSHPWARTIVGHTSGVKTADALAPLARKGAAPLSFHPLQTFAPNASPEVFEDIAIGIEGSDEAVSAGTALARALGGRPVVLTARSKALYHCAAALASNGLVALMAVVEELLGGAALEDGSRAGVDLMAPLVQQTWANLELGTPERVLTGPVARGDETTVETHLNALREQAPHLVPLYAALSTEMARLAVRGGQLDAESAEGLLNLLQKALRTSSDGIDPFNSSR